MNQAFLQAVVLIDCESNEDRADIFPGYFMFFDEGFVSSATVFGGGRGGEVPFYIGGSTDEGNVVEVDYLPSLLASQTSADEQRIPTLSVSSNFGWMRGQCFCFVSGAWRSV